MPTRKSRSRPWIGLAYRDYHRAAFLQRAIRSLIKKSPRKYSFLRDLAAHQIIAIAQDQQSPQSQRLVAQSIVDNVRSLKAISNNLDNI